jgi:hypothetical protein
LLLLFSFFFLIHFFLLFLFLAFISRNQRLGPLDFFFVHAFSRTTGTFSQLATELSILGQRGIVRLYRPRLCFARVHVVSASLVSVVERPLAIAIRFTFALAIAIGSTLLRWYWRRWCWPLSLQGRYQVLLGWLQVPLNGQQ